MPRQRWELRLPQPLNRCRRRQAGLLEEVVVTAQFRNERLQETPIAISAFTGENLKARGIYSVTDLDQFVPNTVIAPLGAGWGATMAAFIRGVGLGDNILSFEPGVPIYVDDVYNGRPQGAIFDLLDLERVEILRGPQGTLFGKNAVGGTVRLISKKPQGDGTGSLSVTIGSYNRIDARGWMDVSLVPEKVFARFSFSSKSADGFFKVLDYECVNGAGSLGTGGPGLPDGPSNVPGGYPGGLPGMALGSMKAPGTSCVVDTLQDEHVQSGRAAFRFLFSDNVELNLIGDITEQRQKGPGDKYTIIDGTNGLNGFWGAVFAAPVFGTGMSYDDRFVTNSLYTNYSRYDDPLEHRLVPNINNLEHWGVSATLEWHLSDNLQPQIDHGVSGLVEQFRPRLRWHAVAEQRDLRRKQASAVHPGDPADGHGRQTGLGRRRLLLRRPRFEPGLRFPLPDDHLPERFVRSPGHHELGGLRARDLPRH